VSRRLDRARRQPAVVAAAVVFAIGGLGLISTHRPPALPVGRHAAIQAVLRNHAAARLLRRIRYDTVAVDDVDNRSESVAFLQGGQVAFQADVSGRGVEPSSIVDYPRGWTPYGDWIAYEPPLLIGLGVLFLLATAVVPLRRIRNLDALAVLSFVAPVVLLQHRYVDFDRVSALPAMLYLLLRCAWVGLGPDRSGSPGTPIYAVVTRGLGAEAQLRILRMILLALALVFIAVGVSSPKAVDVIYAVMEGATRVIHGILPYGHLPGDVFHGDTYPPFSYVLYAPVALLAPVNSTWDSVDVALAATVGAALLTAVLVWAGARPGGSRRRRRGRSDATADPAGQIGGLLAAVAWLSFPPLLIIVSTGTTDITLAAMVALAVLLYRRPAAAAAVLTVAGWFKLAPFALLPVWLAPLRGRRLACAVGAIVAVSLAALGSVVALGGIDGVGAMVRALTFQFDRGSFMSIWGELGIGSLQPIGQAGALALIAAATIQLWRHPHLGASPARLAAISAAVLIAVQLSADYWAFLYLPWFVPLVNRSLLGDLPPAGVALDGQFVENRSNVAQGAADDSRYLVS
jgi:hypothetical protein